MYDNDSILKQFCEFLFIKLIQYNNNVSEISNNFNINRKNITYNYSKENTYEYFYQDNQLNNVFLDPCDFIIIKNK